MTDFKGTPTRGGLPLTSGIGRISVGEEPHENPSPGDIWFDTTPQDEHPNPGLGAQISQDIELQHDQEQDIPWDLIRWGTEEMAHPTDPTKIIIQRNGVYTFVAAMRFTGPRDADHDGWISVNGVVRRGKVGPGNEFQVVMLSHVKAGDEITVTARQRTGSTHSLVAGSRTACTVTWWGEV